MNSYRSPRQPLLALVALLALATLLAGMAIVANSADAAGYGQLARFGERGVQGKTSPTETGKLAALGKRKSVFEQAEVPNYAIGVDPEESNDVFVLDEPVEPKEKQIKGTEEDSIERTIRIQKFTSSGTFVASHSFTVISPPNEEEEPDNEEEAFSNIAIDAKTGVLYVLAEDPREASEAEVPDEETPAATTLYAFNTSNLAPAAHTNAGVLSEKADLGAESATPGEPLLEPRGIAFDPKTKQVIILGHVDPTGESQDDLEEDHYALISVNSETGKVEKHYVDETNVLMHNGEFSEPSAPSSPVVTSEGHILVRVAEIDGTNVAGIVEIPSLLEGVPPTEISKEALNTHAAIEWGVESATGGALSLSPEGDLFEEATYHPSEAKSEGLNAVAARTSNGALIGWSGGQSALNKHKDECVLQLEGETPDLVAAGKEGTVFVLAPEFLELHENEPEVHDAIVELAPGGQGCPAPVAKSPAVGLSEGGVALTEPKVISGHAVELSTSLGQSDALAAEWTIENTSTHVKTVETPNPLEFEGEDGIALLRRPTLKYAFTAAGEYDVKAQVTTDALGSSGHVLSKEAVSTEVLKVTVDAEPAIVTQPKATEADAGSPATFTVAATGTPAPAIQWEVSTNEGKNFTKIAGATSETYKIGSVTTEEDGYEYRAVAENTIEREGRKEVFKAVSSAAKLTVPGGNKEKERIEKEHIEKEEKAAQEKAAQEKAAQEKAAQEKAAQEKAAQEKAAQEKAAQEKAEQEVLGNKSSQTPAVPLVKVVGSTFSVSSSGLLSIKVSCPAGETRCIGTVTLRTLKAVKASAGARAAKAKSAILTLASASFSIAGGATETIKLHLSSAARALLARSHELRAKATLVAHDDAGAKHTQEQVLTLRPAPSKRKH